MHRVYIDATIPSYLVSIPSRVPQIAEWQRITLDFWQDNQFEFILSDLIPNRKLNRFVKMRVIRHPVFNPQRRFWRSSHE